MSLDGLTDGVAVFDRTDELANAGHEQIVFCRDEASGLRAIVGIHSTKLGPALGGTRFYPYASEADALRDVLRLSQGMTFKNAAAGMPLGGGKAVIIGDPAMLKTPNLLRAYGRFVDRLGGYYVTAADVGTTSDDLDVVREETEHVVGHNVAMGGSGDSGLSTARGVFYAMRATAELRWGPGGVRGRVVAVEGAGKVGHHLIALLLDAGASVVVSDPSTAAIRHVQVLYGDSVTVAASLEGASLDIYAPCALGATLTETSVHAMTAGVVCGAANNQLATRSVDGLLFERGVMWVPDYVANAGGVIQVGGELEQRTPEEVLAQLHLIADTTLEILTRSAAEGIPTGAAAAVLVADRLSGNQHRRRLAADLTG